MKTTTATILLTLVAMTAAAFAGPVKLGFEDTINEVERLQTYEVYRLVEEPDGSKGRSLLGQVPADRNEIELDLEPGIYEVVVVAVTTEGLRSADSAPITFLMPAPPTNVRIIIEAVVNAPTE